jgi:hypothetical protein
MSRRPGVEAYVANYVNKTRSRDLGLVPTAARLWTPAEAAEFLGVPIKTPVALHA